ncbi:MAG TPA: hypothetical protein VHA77_14430 [Xanthobacteraceae bacterium]|nr:hypothetical protein [Xanthobacteraceae bacterium]
MRTKNRDTRRWWHGSAAGALIIVGGLAAGCSSTDMFGTSGAHAQAETPSSSSSSGSIGDRISDFLIGRPAQPGEAPVAGGPPPSDFNCPSVDIRQGAGTLSVTAPNAAGQNALGLRYQVNFGQTARECVVLGATVTMKVGVEGRVILGPAGGPGQLTVPLRYALVQEGTTPKTIWTKLYKVPVTIPPDQTNVPFTHVEDDMTIPVPKPAELDAYVIYVGFDPIGAAEESKKGRGKPKRKS